MQIKKKKVVNEALYDKQEFLRNLIVSLAKIPASKIEDITFSNAVERKIKVHLYFAKGQVKG